MRLILASNGSDLVQKSPELLAATGTNLKVINITTAGFGQSPPYISDTPSYLETFGHTVTDFDLRGKSEKEIRKHLEETDMVLVNGGNTFYLLDHVRRTGFDRIVREYVEAGLTYFGSSAGSILAGPSVEVASPADDPEAAPMLTDYTGLNLVNFVVIPHWKNEKYHSIMQKTYDAYSTKYQLVTIEDDQAVLVSGTDFRIV